MRKLLVVIAFVFAFASNVSAQEIKTVSLEQTKGEFTQKQITLSEGTYVFEISNTGVGHNVGFVLAPKGKTDQANHIKNAYVTKPVATGKTESTKKVTLKKGEYVYFCPLNPTPQYTLIVK
ncbi:hypothetical protein GWK08_02960 [Leptobacterium flavescens]|uniref:EfeO-type cupredoxin-like domain-containing protein n=1 Tax=Leptobacterium flavescens TaxID=472055 RepID=A0A6P0UKH4_9FLAO|nr:cupredoxin domain-containing protein [Leptobacterium flavescens]NER12388.1 hypothetical protein [Leptobacterium flavescens]